MDDVVRLVVRRYDGALKAEHGTGRNMAPFVEAEWGRDAYAVMRRVKALVDPDGLLNPGVIINADPRAHLRHLKALPAVEDEVDACIECGYCEPRCPSRDLTLTPRQRIVVTARDRAARGRRECSRARRHRGGLPVRGARHLRGGRPLRDRVPGEHRHGAAHQAAAGVAARRRRRRPSAAGSRATCGWSRRRCAAACASAGLVDACRRPGRCSPRSPGCRGPLGSARPLWLAADASGGPARSCGRRAGRMPPPSTSRPACPGRWARSPASHASSRPCRRS